MRLFLFYVSIISVLIISNSCKKNSTEEILSNNSFNSKWYFNKSDDPESNWVSVDIPHTPRIESLIVNDQWQGSMWYKKDFIVTDVNKKYFLKFQGVMNEAELFLNERKIAYHAGGYLPFVADLTDMLNFNEPNEIKLHISNEDNPQIPPGKALELLDFNYYGGIYRNVCLIQKNKIYITDAVYENKVASGGVLVHFHNISNENANGIVKVHVRNDSDEESIVSCEINLTDPKGITSTYSSEKKLINPGSDTEFIIELSVSNPLLWSVKKPWLYTLEVNLNNEQTLKDKEVLNIGIRDIKLKKDGFYLNNERLYIRGTNRHQEYPYVGYAISENANWRDAVKIKQAGFDFVRLSHYPHDKIFLDACDKLGLLVMNAIPGWQFFGDSVFAQNSYQDIRDMVRRDRNHPCVIFWEVSLNESRMTEEYMVKANKILKEELPYEETYSAGWIDHPSYDLFIPARQHARPPDYWNKYKVNERPVFIAEYGDWEYYAQNAGFNQTEFKNLKEEERTSRQLRGYGEKRLLQQALNYQEAVNSNRKGPSTIGHANWLMFDYNRGYADDIEASGISDIFRIPKFAFYFYQSQRSANDTLALKHGTGPMVKIASYWTDKSNKKTRVFSNCEEVALYLNDSLIEKCNSIKDQYSDYLVHPPFHFLLKKFVPGTLKAVGYINGSAVCEDIVRTPGEPKGITLEIDKSTIKISPNASDLVFVYAKITDEKGTVCPMDTSLVTFSVECNGVLIGDNPAKAEAGISTILLKTKPGEKCNVRADSEGLEGGEVEL